MSYHYGPMPGTDLVQATKISSEYGEECTLPVLPERGYQNDLLATTLTNLPELYVDKGVRTWQTMSRPQRMTQVLHDHYARDLDTIAEHLPDRISTIYRSVLGPWTVLAKVEDRRGHRLLTDLGARRAVLASYPEAMKEMTAQLTERFGCHVELLVLEPLAQALVAGSLEGTHDFDRIPPLDVSVLAEGLQAEGMHIGFSGAQPPLAMAAQARTICVSAQALQEKHTLDGLAGVLDSGQRLGLNLVKPTDSAADIYSQAIALLSQLGFGEDRVTQVDMLSHEPLSRYRLGQARTVLRTCHELKQAAAAKSY